LRGGETLFAASSTAGHASIINKAAQVSGAGNGGTAFINTATAGNASITNKGGATAGANSGFTSFNGNQSSAGNANITNEGATANGASGGGTGFTNATADNAKITNNGGTVSGAGGGSTSFSESDGNNATIVANAGLVSGAGGGAILFPYYAGGGNMTLIAHGGPGSGGTIQFSGGSGTDGETARIEVFGNGNLDISARPVSAGPLTIGSIEGSGLVFLGALNLTVGSNNRSTTFSGVMQDGGIGGGTGGSLTKIGSGTLTLSGANTYTGGTTIEGGTLLVTTRGASPTGTGPVQVNVGTLSGTSILSGAITVGNGTGTGAFLAPGVNGPGILTTSSSVSFILGSNATYICEVSTTTMRSDQISANGVSISSDALFSFVAIGNQTIPIGTVFIVIKNTSGGAIAGTFANLADGSTFTVGSNTFKANYEGGDGNDLTLTVQ
jgi:autotransporter-associated beta strand protein